LIISNITFHLSIFTKPRSSAALLWHYSIEYHVNCSRNCR